MPSELFSLKYYLSMYSYVGLPRWGVEDRSDEDSTKVFCGVLSVDTWCSVVFFEMERGTGISTPASPHPSDLIQGSRDCPTRDDGTSRLIYVYYDPKRSIIGH